MGTFLLLCFYFPTRQMFMLAMPMVGLLYIMHAQKYITYFVHYTIRTILIISLMAGLSRYCSVAL